MVPYLNVSHFIFFNMLTPFSLGSPYLFLMEIPFSTEYMVEIVMGTVAKIDIERTRTKKKKIIVRNCIKLNEYTYSHTNTHNEFGLSVELSITCYKIHNTHRERESE